MLYFVTMLVGGVRDDIYVALGSRFGLVYLETGLYITYVGVSVLHLRMRDS